MFELDQFDNLCDIALNGREAVNQIKQNVEENNTYCSYKLILMDCNMPILDGYEATTEIRNYLYYKNLRQPIIIAITGHTGDLYE